MENDERTRFDKGIGLANENVFKETIKEKSEILKEGQKNVQPETKPSKADSNIKINSNLMSVCFTLFTIMWTFAPNRFKGMIILHFILAIPLLYLSSISYSKVAYRDKAKKFESLAIYTGNVATALILNIIAILTAILGFRPYAYLYYALLWIGLGVYTIINISYHGRDESMTEEKRRSTVAEKVRKYFLFIAVQIIFGLLPIIFQIEK